MAESDKDIVPGTEDPTTKKRPARSRRPTSNRVSEIQNPPSGQGSAPLEAVEFPGKEEAGPGILATEEGTAAYGKEPAIVEAAIVEAAVTPEFEILEELSKQGLDALEELGAEGLEAAESAAGSFAKTLVKLTTQAASYSKESLDSGSELLKELRRAKSFPAAVHIQIDYANSAYIGLLKHLLKMNGLCWKLMEEGSKHALRSMAKAKA